MALPTVKVICQFYDQNGNAAKGAAVRFKLTTPDMYLGVIAPEEITAVADAEGRVDVFLFPNALGTAGSNYQVRAVNPDTGRKFIDGLVFVPNSECHLEDIFQTEPTPAVDDARRAVQEAQAYAIVSREAADEAIVAAESIADSTNVARGYAEAAEVSAGEAETSNLSSLAASAIAVRAQVRQAANPPSDPLPNQEWIDTDTGRRYVYYVDTNGAHWVEAGSVAYKDDPASVNAAVAAATAAASAAVAAIEAKDTAVEVSESALGTFSEVAPVSPLAGKRWTSAITGKTYEWIIDQDGGQWVETGATVAIGSLAIMTDLLTALGASRIGSQATGNGTIARTVAQRLDNFFDARETGVIADGAARSPSALQAALDANANVLLPSGVMQITSGVSIDIGHAIIGAGMGKGNTSQPARGSRIQAANDMPYLFKYAGPMGANGKARFLYIRGVVFDGNGKTFSDALAVIEGAYFVIFDNCTFCGAVGRAMRLRVAFEVSFRGCVFSENKAALLESILFDQKYAGNSQFNTNNITFDGNCHFESNEGTIIRIHEDANCDILRIIGAKFEYGDLSTGSADWTALDLRNVHRLFIGSGTTFTNFEKARNFDTIIAISNDAGAPCTDALIDGVGIRGTSGDTTFLRNKKGAFTVVGSVGFQSNNDIAPKLENTSSGSLKTAGLRNANGTNSGVTSRDVQNRSGAISIHEAAWYGNGQEFVVDAQARNIQKTALKAVVTASDVVLADLPVGMFTGSANGKRFGIRVRTQNGVGKVKPLVGSAFGATQLVGTTYSTKQAVYSESSLATLGDSVGDRIRWVADGSIADTFFVDLIYQSDLPGSDPGLPVPFFSQSVATNTLIQVPLPAATNANQRGVFLIRGDANAAGMYALVEISGSGGAQVLTQIFTGSLIATGTTDPAVGGKINVYLTAGVLTIRNLLAADRRITVYPFAF